MSDPLKRLTEHKQRKVGKVVERTETAMDYIVSSYSLMSAYNKADEQSAKLLREVLDELQDRLRIDRGTQEAIQRLKGLAEQGKAWDEATIRNNVFKAAHSLGMKLPSYSF